MLLLVDSAVAILRNGGGLRVPSSKFIMADNLVTLAAAAAAGGARLEIKVDSLLLADQMVRIAAAGKGHVLFEVD